MALGSAYPSSSSTEHIYSCYSVPGPVQSIWVYKDNRKPTYHKKLLVEIPLNLDHCDLFVTLQLQPFYMLIHGLNDGVS